MSGIMTFANGVRSYTVAKFRDDANGLMPHNPGRVRTAIHTMVCMEVRSANGSRRYTNESVVRLLDLRPGDLLDGHLVRDPLPENSQHCQVRHCCV